ncbi:MAG: molybdenum cofactor guanylyltransferase [Methanobrevibacter sp.]|uniref:molybdenum cofactor guanylyltransferase n=1 Tax=Methanobrevibacter sp. TaxID=66852 RepID=UPI001B434BA4|nr:molybdenum cofactor guanylyltransferase [Methanobrevibacter sp.]MBP3791919.1 molybdenum cofactor guanylyltransferase [Methanobrevibacter sp.]
MSNEIEKSSENIKSCIVLCGGQSRRMGQDKGSMIIQDKPMIKHVLSTLNDEINEVVIVLNDKERIGKYSQFINPKDYTYNLTFVEDKIKNKGPLPGIMTGLEQINSNYALILPCDSPYVSKSYIHAIFKEIDDEYQAIVPYHDDENMLKTSEPLHSIYNKNIISTIEDLLGEDTLHIKGMIEKVNAKFVLIDNKKIEKKEFRNLNRPTDI